MEFVLYRASSDGPIGIRTITTIEELMNLRRQYGYDLIIESNPLYQENIKYMDIPRNMTRKITEIPICITIYDSCIE